MKIKGFIFLCDIMLLKDRQPVKIYSKQSFNNMMPIELQMIGELGSYFEVVGHNDDPQNGYITVKMFDPS